MSTEEKPKFSPAYIGPSIEELVEQRVRWLRDMLSDKSVAHQPKNIEFAISLYERGQLPSAAKPTLRIMDGKVLDGPPTPHDIQKGTVLWVEVRLTFILSYYFTYQTFRH